jgi:hypothetical protein
MDGLSGTASGIAVVSLTFQIVESISKLRNFFESIKTAPKDIARIVENLQQLSSVLSTTQAMPSDLVSTCMDKIRSLHVITDELEPGFRSSNRKTRQWTSFKAAHKDEVLRRFRIALEETKTTLTLALQIKNLSLR